MYRWLSAGHIQEIAGAKPDLSSNKPFVSSHQTRSEPMASRRSARPSQNLRRALEPERSIRDSEVPDEIREFYTVRQLADLLQLTEMTIYRMVNRRELPCYAIGRVKRFRHRDVEEFLDACRVPAAKTGSPSEPE
jgi:excisionase family DNA binding protein